MSANKRGYHDTPCKGCDTLPECEGRAANDTCRAFRRYTCEGQHDAIQWVPGDRGVFDMVGV